jgi:hypothetical protein
MQCSKTAGMYYRLERIRIGDDTSPAFAMFSSEPLGFARRDAIAHIRAVSIYGQQLVFNQKIIHYRKGNARYLREPPPLECEPPLPGAFTFGPMPPLGAFPFAPMPPAGAFSFAPPAGCIPRLGATQFLALLQPLLLPLVQV